MNTETRFPKTLVEAVRCFADEDVCEATIAELIWPDGVPVCPHCEHAGAYRLKGKSKIWKCAACRQKFSIKVGTVFEGSHIKLSNWLCAFWLICNAKNGISSWEIHRALGITQKSAWFLLGRIRAAMQDRTFRQLKGEVEVDETFIGGKARFMHKHKRDEKIHGRGAAGKVAVMGLLERHGGKVRTMVVPNVKRRTLKPAVQEHVEPGTAVFTDALKSYEGLDPEYVHSVIDHAERYVDGNTHTNGMENYWCLLKRCIKGTYVQVEPFHLHRYLDEQTFRFTNRSTNDAERFRLALKSIVGRRLTYKRLTGNVMPLESNGKVVGSEEEAISNGTP